MAPGSTVRKGGGARAAKRRAQFAWQARVLRHVSALDDCPSRRAPAFKTHRPPAARCPPWQACLHEIKRGFFLGSGWIVPPCAGGFFPFVFSAAGWPVNGLSAVGRPSTEPGGPTTWCNLFLILAHRVGMGDRGGYSRGIRPPPLLPRLPFLCSELRRGGAIPVGFGVLLALGYPPSQIGFGIGMWGLFP